MRELQDGIITDGDPQQIADWRILARLGAGGMGVVYLGERDGTRAAIKTIRSDLEVDPTFRKRFEREAAAVANANSDRIARIIESDLDTTPAYIAFEFYDGPNLRDVVKQGGALDLSALQALAVGLAEGLEAIHSEGVVHRDIKPSNIIMTARGPVIIDFGIAAYEASELTQLTTTGEPIGSPTWMSPEYITTGHASEPGDVFGWAATGQFAATGQPPFGMGATQPLLYRITNVEPTPHGIAGPLGRLVTQALSKRPESRPSTAEVLDVLLSGDMQTGSTPQLRLPLPAPITAGHRMNIGSAPTAPPPITRVTDTIVPPPPTPPPPPRPPAKSRSTLATVLLVLGALFIAVMVLPVLGMFFLRSGGGEVGVVERVGVPVEAPRVLPTAIPLLPNRGPTPSPLTPIALELDQVGRSATENGRDRFVLDRHLQFIDAYFDEMGQPIGDQGAIADAINGQLEALLSPDVPMVTIDVTGFNSDQVAQVHDRRRAFNELAYYPDLIESAVNAATGQSPAGSTTSSVSSTLRVMIDSIDDADPTTPRSLFDGLRAAAPALIELEDQLESMAGGGHTDLDDPDVQAAFGRFVRQASRQIAAPLAQP